LIILIKKHLPKTLESKQIEETKLSTFKNESVIKITAEKIFCGYLAR